MVWGKFLEPTCVVEGCNRFLQIGFFSFTCSLRPARTHGVGSGDQIYKNYSREKGLKGGKQGYHMRRATGSSSESGSWVCWSTHSSSEYPEIKAATPTHSTKQACCPHNYVFEPSRIPPFVLSTLFAKEQTQVGSNPKTTKSYMRGQSLKRIKSVS